MTDEATFLATRARVLKRIKEAHKLKNVSEAQTRKHYITMARGRRIWWMHHEQHRRRDSGGSRADLHRRSHLVPL
jgi:hypothetical protein